MSYILENSIKIIDGKTCIKNERMKDIAWECDGESAENYNEFTDELASTIYSKVIDQDRWSTFHEHVFKIGSSYYKSYYSEGSTEMQDEAPYEHDGDWVEVAEVVPKEVVRIEYVEKER